MVSNGIHPQEFYHMPVDWGHSGMWGVGLIQTHTHIDTTTQTPPHTHARAHATHSSPDVIWWYMQCLKNKAKKKEKRA